MKFSVVSLLALALSEPTTAQMNELCAAPPLCAPPPNGAVILSCGATISQAGVYVLTGNLVCTDVNVGQNSKAITIEGPGDSRIAGTVTLDCQGNTIDGGNLVNFGIAELQADTVVIKNCIVQGFINNGIGDENDASEIGEILIVDNVISTDNGEDGMDINVPQGGDRDGVGATSVTIRNSRFDDNRDDGLVINADGAFVNIIDTTASNNDSDGIRSGRPDMTFALTGVEANGNGENGNGFGITISANIAVTLLDTQACDNEGSRDIRFPNDITNYFGMGVVCDKNDPDITCDC